MTKEAQERARMLGEEVSGSVQQEEAMKRLQAAIEELDPEAAARLVRAGHGRTPNSWRMPHETQTFFAEGLAAVAEQVAQMRKPRPRGRPRTKVK